VSVQGNNEGRPELGPVEWGKVVEYHLWGYDVKLDDSGDIGLVDAVSSHDLLERRIPDCWPALGDRIKVRRLGVAPSGQLRLTGRQSDIDLN